MTTGERFTAHYVDALASATETAASQLADCAATCLTRAEAAPGAGQVALLEIAAIYETASAELRAVSRAHLGAP